MELLLSSGRIVRREKPSSDDRRIYMGLISRLFSLKANLGSLFGGGGNSVQNLAVPAYQTNPTYTQTTQNLAQLSANMISGQLPSAYSDLGNPNSQQYQAVRNNLIGSTN